MQNCLNSLSIGEFTHTCFSPFYVLNSKLLSRMQHLLLEVVSPDHYHVIITEISFLLTVGTQLIFSE